VREHTFIKIIAQATTQSSHKHENPHHELQLTTTPLAAQSRVVRIDAVKLLSNDRFFFIPNKQISFSFAYIRTPSDAMRTVRTNDGSARLSCTIVAAALASVAASRRACTRAENNHILIHNQS
jgi:hypothetical protein